MASDKITLQACDGQLISADARVCKMSITLRDRMDDSGIAKIKETPIPLSRIKGDTLKTVLGWCEYHLDNDLATYGGMNYYEKREEIEKWESELMSVDTAVLLEIIEGAKNLEVPDLLERSCKAASDKVKAGSLTALDGLPRDVQNQIAQGIPPYSLLNAAKAGIVDLTPEQQYHAKTWTRIFPCDTWFEAANKVGAGPTLFARDMKHPSFVVLASLDWTGDLQYELPSGKTIRDYLQPGRYENGDYHLEDGLVVRIAEDDGCKVRDLEETFVHTREDGSWELSVMYLKDPKIQQLVCKKPHRNSGRLVLRTNHMNPNCYKPIDFILLDEEYKMGFNQKREDMRESEFRKWHTAKAACY